MTIINTCAQPPSWREIECLRVLKKQSSTMHLVTIIILSLNIIILSSIISWFISWLSLELDSVVLLALRIMLAIDILFPNCTSRKKRQFLLYCCLQEYFQKDLILISFLYSPLGIAFGTSHVGNPVSDWALSLVDQSQKRPSWSPLLSKSSSPST